MVSQRQLAQQHVPVTLFIQQVLGDLAVELIKMHTDPACVTHNDIKSDNIFLASADGTAASFRAYLGDLGFASERGKNEATNLATDPPVPADMPFYLPSGHMNPDVIELCSSPPADIWRLGLTMLQLVGPQETEVDELFYSESFIASTQDDINSEARRRNVLDLFDCVRRNSEAAVSPTEDISEARVRHWRACWRAVNQLPQPLNRIIKAMLNPNPVKRPSARMLQALMQTFTPHAYGSAMLVNGYTHLKIGHRENTARIDLAHQIRRTHPQRAMELNPMNSFDTVQARRAASNTSLAKQHPELERDAVAAVQRGDHQRLNLCLRSGLLGVDTPISGRSLMEMTAEHKQSECIAILLDHGAQVSPKAAADVVRQNDSRSANILLRRAQHTLFASPEGVEGSAFGAAIRNGQSRFIVECCRVPIHSRYHTALGRLLLTAPAEGQPRLDAVAVLQLSRFLERYAADDDVQTNTAADSVVVPLEMPAREFLLEFVDKLQRSRHEEIAKVSQRMEEMRSLYENNLQLVAAVRLLNEDAGLRRAHDNPANDELRRLRDENTRLQSMLTSERAGHATLHRTDAALDAERGRKVDDAMAMLEAAAHRGILTAGSTSPAYLTENTRLPPAVCQELSVYFAMTRGDDLEDVLAAVPALCARLWPSE